MNPKTRDVEARTMEKIRVYGKDAVMYFSQDEFAWYSTMIEPVILLQVRANIENSLKTVN
jgi:hypothetical protein